MITCLNLPGFSLGYLSKARTLQNKLERSKETSPVRDITDILISLELERRTYPSQREIIFNFRGIYRMDHQSDSEIVKPLVERITSLFPVKSWSFDKGFWHKDNKKLLEEYIDCLISYNTIFAIVIY